MKRLLNPRLYFIHEAGSNNCKIGYTTNLKVRRENLQVANPNKLVITASLGVLNGKLAEKHAHSKFKDRKIRGEWFYVTPREAEDFVNKRAYDFT